MIGKIFVFKPNNFYVGVITSKHGREPSGYDIYDVRYSTSFGQHFHRCYVEYTLRII